MPPVSEAQFAFLLQLYISDRVGFALSLKGGPGGIRAYDLQAPSPNCLVVHPLDLPKSTKISKIQNPQNPKSKIPKIQNPKSPKSKIQNPKSPKSKIPKIQNPPNPKSKIQNPQILDFGDFGFWILDRYVANLYVRPPTPQILDFGRRFWILGILDFGFCRFWILGILDFGDFGFWILGRYVANLYVRPPTPQIWGILDFGDFGDFGFWILDFGDFGVWGFWILDFGLDST